MTTFTLNGRTFVTDPATVDMLNTIIPAAKAANDSTAVAAVIAAGEASGRIREIAPGTFHQADAGVPKVGRVYVEAIEGDEARVRFDAGDCRRSREYRIRITDFRPSDARGWKILAGSWGGAA